MGRLRICLTSALWLSLTALCVLLTGGTVQLITVGSISLERYQALHKPFDNKYVVLRIKVSLVCSWLVGLSLMVLSWTTAHESPTLLLCARLHQFPSYKLGVYMFLPLTFATVGVILFFYGRILFLVQKHVKTTQKNLRGKTEDDEQKNKKKPAKKAKATKNNQVAPIGEALDSIKFLMLNNFVIPSDFSIVDNDYRGSTLSLVSTSDHVPHLSPMLAYKDNSSTPNANSPTPKTGRKSESTSPPGDIKTVTERVSPLPVLPGSTSGENSVFRSATKQTKPNGLVRGTDEQGRFASLSPVQLAVEHADSLPTPQVHLGTTSNSLAGNAGARASLMTPIINGNKPDHQLQGSIEANCSLSPSREPCRTKLDRERLLTAHQTQGHSDHEIPPSVDYNEHISTGDITSDARDAKVRDTGDLGFDKGKRAVQLVTDGAVVVDPSFKPEAQCDHEHKNTGENAQGSDDIPTKITSEENRRNKTRQTEIAPGNSALPNGEDIPSSMSATQRATADKESPSVPVDTAPAQTNSTESTSLESKAVQSSAIKEEKTVQKEEKARPSREKRKTSRPNRGSKPKTSVVKIYDAEGQTVKAKTSRQTVAGDICVINTSNKIRGKRKIEAKSAKRAAIVLVTFLVAWLPFPLVILVSWRLQPLGGDTARTTALVSAYLVALTLSLLAASVNPLVYGAINKQFSKEFKKIYKKCKQRCFAKAKSS